MVLRRWLQRGGDGSSLRPGPTRGHRVWLGRQRWVRTRLFDYPSSVPQVTGPNVQVTGYLPLLVLGVSEGVRKLNDPIDYPTIPVRYPGRVLVRVAGYLSW